MRFHRVGDLSSNARVPHPPDLPPDLPPLASAARPDTVVASVHGTRADPPIIDFDQMSASIATRSEPHREPIVSRLWRWVAGSGIAPVVVASGGADLDDADTLERPPSGMPSGPIDEPLVIDGVYHYGDDVITSARIILEE
jgi:hypothetical protein